MKQIKITMSNTEYELIKLNLERNLLVSIKELILKLKEKGNIEIL